jgi:hypothetical protein
MVRNKIQAFNIETLEVHELREELRDNLGVVLCAHHIVPFGLVHRIDLDLEMRKWIGKFTSSMVTAVVSISAMAAASASGASSATSFVVSFVISVRMASIGSQISVARLVNLLKKHYTTFPL